MDKQYDTISSANMQNHVFIEGIMPGGIQTSIIYLRQERWADTTWLCEDIENVLYTLLLNTLHHPLIFFLRPSLIVVAFCQHGKLSVLRFPTLGRRTASTWNTPTLGRAKPGTAVSCTFNILWTIGMSWQENVPVSGKHAIEEYRCKLTSIWDSATKMNSDIVTRNHPKAEKRSLPGFPQNIIKPFTKFENTQLASCTLPSIWKTTTSPGLNLCNFHGCGVL